MLDTLRRKKQTDLGLRSAREIGDVANPVSPREAIFWHLYAGGHAYL